MKPVICGLCKEAIRKGDRLKSHWRNSHPEEFVKRMQWLGQSQAKLRSAILLAEDGMKGCEPGDQANLGPEFRVSKHEQRVDAARYEKQVRELGVNPDDEEKFPEEEEE